MSLPVLSAVDAVFDHDAVEYGGDVVDGGGAGCVVTGQDAVYRLAQHELGVRYVDDYVFTHRDTCTSACRENSNS